MTSKEVIQIMTSEIAAILADKNPNVYLCGNDIRSQMACRIPLCAGWTFDRECGCLQASGCVNG